ncbi:hypothetical protein KKC13_09830 [bacterium]|nr:hypothetical protein [bacterium]MBU1958341.1 hypothetical protein [bacterium]
MNSIFKKLLFVWTLFFTSFLYADGVVTTINISNATSVNEADAGSTKMRFTVTLSDTPFLFTKVSYTTSNGSATAGSDYVAKSGDLWFLAWESSKTIEIDILDDTVDENNEYLYVNVSTTATGYEVDDGRGYGYIIDDEATPIEVRAYNQSITEQDSGTNDMNFKIYLNQLAPAGGVTVTYTTSDNTAVKNDDYIETTGSVTIPEGSSYVYVSVPIVSDLLPESQERFYLNLSNTNVGTLKTTRVSGYINDNDAIKVDISSSDVQEGNNGDSNKMPFRIFLSKPYPLTTPLTITYQTQDGSTPSATTGLDYTAKSGSVTFNQGDVEKLVYVDIIGDDDIEPDENLKMIISGSSYIIDDNSESEILNDDGSYPGVNFTTTPFSINEGDVGQKDLEFTFTLDKPALAGTSFKYYTQDDEAKISDNDYDEVPLTTYTIPEGETQIRIVVKINGDTSIEPNETFYLKIQDEVNINVTGHTAEGIILNDDGSYPSLTFEHNSYSISEGNSGQKDLNFTMILDQPALAGSAFDYFTQDSTAQTSDSDYVAIPTTTHTIPVGATQITIPVKINGDTEIESDESFYLKITNEVNLTFSGSQQTTGTILNDDGDYPTIRFDQNKYSIVEGDSGVKDLNITFTLNAPALADTQLDYHTQDRTAQDGSNSSKDSDYVATAGTLFIPSGSTTASILVPINGDKNIEPDEEFYFNIRNIVNLQMSVTKVKVTIENDDVHNEEPFICDNHMYLSSSIKRGSTETGKMWLHRIDTGKTPFGFEVMDDVGELKLYNALAYSTDDNYIYGLYKKELIKLSKTGKVISLGNILDLPAILTTKQLFAGAIYNGEYYISGPGVDYDKIYKINLLDKSVSEITLNTAISLLDFSFTPDGQYLHGIVDGGRMVKIDVDMNSTDLGKVNFIGEAHTGYQFDSSFSDKNGRFFANDSYGHGFFEFDLTTGTKQFLSDSQPADFNDGANCLLAELVFNDYGDAPSSYGTPKHNIANGVFMGSEVDHDVHSYADITATGDDLNGIDDEDGVTLIDGSDLNGSYFALNTLQELKIKASKAGYLNVWLDYNINGVFDTGEKIIDAKLLLAGEQTISFTVPNGLVVNKTTYIRFRFSSTQTLDATENAADGEVEDYAIKFGTAFTPLKGTFNIERTNSGAYAIGLDQRNAWYTQIVGRDFDYSILLYDETFTTAQEMDNVTVKVELVNTESNTTLYERYAHIKNTPPLDRIDSVSGVNAPIDDLATLPASKDVHFRISYGVDDADGIIQADCAGDPQVCFNSFTKTRTDLAQDNFAIRPEQFNVRIADGDTVLPSTPSPLRLAAGYDYNLTLIAGQYNDVTKASPDYNASIPRILKFIGSINCANQEDNVTTETLRDGHTISDRNSSLYNPFTFDNVGHYTLLKFIDKEWTKVDWNKVVPDCIKNSTETPSDANLLSGCDIAAPDDTNISFYPHHFAVNFAMNNLPNSGHDSLIYMSELNAGYNDVAVQFEGNITAKSEGNITTTNFIDGCMAENVIVAPDALIKSEDGINQLLRTSHQANLSPQRANVNIRRMVRFNGDVNDTHFASINYFTNGLTIPASKFLVGNNNGSMTLDLRYNIDKHHSRTINPIHVNFNSIAINAIDAQSSANGIVNYYTPSGGQQFTNNVRNFYFTQVAPDDVIYHRVNVDVSPTIRTPLNVEIFCDKNSSYCDETNLTAYTNINSSPRRDAGWYLSTGHDSNNDGQVIQLDDTPDIVDIAPDENITFVHGRNGLVINTFNDCVPPFETTVVTITPSPVLQYHPNPANNGLPTYEIPCKRNPSAWSGLGETGNIVETNTTTNTAGKIDW